MSVHRESADITAVISGLTHTSVSTKKTALNTLLSDLNTEQGLVNTERTNLQTHRDLVTGLITDLDVVGSAVEYTTVAGSGTLPVGKTVYCDVNYAGGSSNGSRERPYSDLGAALDAKSGIADATERIYDLACGVYTVSKTITKNAGIFQKVTFRGRGAHSTFLQAGSDFASGKALDCLRLEGFGSLKVEDLCIRFCKYGLRATCKEFTLRRCAFTQCGCDATATQFDNSLTLAQQLTAYASTTDGGALRVDLADGFVRVEDNFVSDCNRGLRIGNSVKGGSVKRNQVQRTLQAGIYLSSSSYDGANGCRNFHVSDNQVINSCNGSVLLIGTRDCTVSENLCKGSWNAPVMLWHCSTCTVSDNKIEKGNFSTFNGQGVLGDSFCGGIIADGDTNITASATYQCRITNNLITEPGAGRVVNGDIFAIRIKNTAFSNGNKVFIQGNHSQGADVHFVNDGLVPAAVLDMDQRAPRPLAATVYENLTNGNTVQLSKNDTIALIKHDQVENLTIVMPPDAEDGKIICVKNFHIGDGSQGGNYIITVIAAPFQTPTNHVIDYKYSSLELKASTIASGLLSDVNETVRLMWKKDDASWICLNDSF